MRVQKPRNYQRDKETKTQQVHLVQPPYSKTVKSNVGRTFLKLQLIAKHFLLLLVINDIYQVLYKSIGFLILSGLRSVLLREFCCRSLLESVSMITDSRWVRCISSRVDVRGDSHWERKRMEFSAKPQEWDGI